MGTVSCLSICLAGVTGGHPLTRSPRRRRSGVRRVRRSILPLTSTRRPAASAVSRSSVGRRRLQRAERRRGVRRPGSTISVDGRTRSIERSPSLHRDADVRRRDRKIYDARVPDFSALWTSGRRGGASTAATTTSGLSTRTTSTATPRTGTSRGWSSYALRRHGFMRSWRSAFLAALVVTAR